MRKGLIFGLLVIVLAIVAIAALLYRPATVIGASGKSLAYSLREEAEAAETGACNGTDDEFTCTAFDASASDPVPYDVSVDNYGCWDATLGKGGSPKNLPEKLSGCITIVDLVRSGD